MPLEKALLINTVTGDEISVMFNPEEYTLNRDNNFAQTAIPGLSAPLLQFVNGNLKTLDMELFFDTYEGHRSGSRILNQTGQDVRELTNKVIGLMEIDGTTHAPPVLLFTWGSLTFTCVLARASQRFLLFLPDGTPVRARLQVTFNEFKNVELEAREIKRETADYTKVRVVRQGEDLSSIAAEVYGDAALWRPIALLNAVEDPRELETGSRLVVPRLPFRDPESGEVFETP